MKTRLKTKAFYYTLCGVFVFATAVFLSAALAAAAKAANRSVPAPPAGLINCFQYYSFGSVGINLNPERFTYYPENSMVFKGTLENKNKYPIVDGQLYVKLYRRDPQGAEAKNGNFEIAEFPALSNINIDGQKTKDVSFEYALPKGAANGDYLAQFFFNVSGKYNLAGLSFQDSIPGGTAGFRIASTADQAIFFDKDNAKLNDKPYGFRLVNDTLENGGKITVSVPLKNPTKNSVEIEVQKDVYFWDALNEKDKLDSKTEKVMLGAGNSQNVTYTIEKPQYSVYFVRFTAKSSAGQSIISVRPTVGDIFQPRLNYPALASFPLKAGQKSVLFSCFHNAGTLVRTGKVSLTLKDSQGKVIAEQIYNGDIPSEMVATAKEFTPQENYNKVTLSAELYNDKNELVDSSTQNYDCSQFDPSICNNAVEKPTAPIAVALPPKNSVIAPSLWELEYKKVFAAIAIIILIIAGYIIIKTVKKK